MRISHIPVIGAKVPFSLYSTHSNHNVARTAALQAISGHEVTIYGSDDSPIIAEAAELAEKYGKRIHRSAKAFTIEDGGSLTLRSIERTVVPDRTPAPKAMLADKPLYDLAIADERKKPSDILAVHTVWYSGYLKNAGLSNVLIHAHMNAQPFANMQGELLEVAKELQCDIKDGQLVPSHPTIALTQTSAQGWRDAGADVIGFINHGIDMPPAEEVKKHSSGYLLSLGRISPEKKVDEAIEVAKQSGKPLIITGTIALEGDDQIIAPQENYYLNKIKPHITEFADTLSLEELKERIRQLAEHEGSYGNNPPIIYVGKALGETKSYLYQNADATFFLAEPEAFGLPQIESLAYGTPVITYSQDGIIENGITGFEVQSVAEAVEAVGKIDQIDRLEARHFFENRFNVNDEVQEIEWIYNRVFVDKFLKEYQSESGELKHPQTEQDKEQFDIFARICKDAHLSRLLFTTTRIRRALPHWTGRIKELTAGLIKDPTESFSKIDKTDREAIVYAAMNRPEFEEDQSIGERINTILQEVRDPLAMQSVLDAYKNSISSKTGTVSGISLPKIHQSFVNVSSSSIDLRLPYRMLRVREIARGTQTPQILVFKDGYLVVQPDSELTDLIKDFRATRIRKFLVSLKSPESQLARMIGAELPQAIEEGDQSVVEWIGKLAGLRGNYDPRKLGEMLISAGYEHNYHIDDPKTETDPSEYAKWLIGQVVKSLRQGMRISYDNSEKVRRYHELVRNDRQTGRKWTTAVKSGTLENNRKASGRAF